MPERPRVEDLITLAEAAHIGGYAGQHSLSQAARRGSLKAVQRGRLWLTTRDWLEEYIARRPGNAPHEAQRRARQRERGYGEGEQR